jgi:hypothetical protein
LWQIKLIFIFNLYRIYCGSIFLFLTLQSNQFLIINKNKHRKKVAMEG